jgi:hypothetical protein
MRHRGNPGALRFRQDRIGRDDAENGVAAESKRGPVTLSERLHGVGKTLAGGISGARDDSARCRIHDISERIDRSQRSDFQSIGA